MLKSRRSPDQHALLVFVIASNTYFCISHLSPFEFDFLVPLSLFVVSSSRLCNHPMLSVVKLCVISYIAMCLEVSGVRLLL